LLTPLGFETSISELRTPAFEGFFVAVGLLLPLAGLAALLFLAAPAD
jgi:hypothetical protein